MSLVLDIFGALGLIWLVIWLLSLPGDDDEEEILGFLAGNWWRFWH